MNQGGLKNVVTEPSRLENKRERRRGAAGRAAALRRAPSDSDCSGETASLSADSGDRAPRPPPLPTRAGKNRGRRRGSEWEVLEGLKDGQRFEKRPDVFNGYLHKKRKWPLKGWHKRFFVVDGGILVYARSPTDVARGRLHGSVDVGLSVISAKARRRRIDIDADEFIYHLRAKTPEVFRTWLNVLKAHRLYRQHLLTFGARELVPKIHAPLDDLPATDNNSSRTSQNTETTTISTSDDLPFNGYDHFNQDLRNNSFCFCHTTFHSTDKRKLSLTPFKQPNVNKVLNHRSLCSMNCVARVANEDIKRLSSNASPGTTDAEKQVHSTDLDINSIRTIDTVVEDEMLNTKALGIRYSPVSSEGRRPLLLEKVEPTTTFFFFSRNKPIASSHSPMKKSKKSTNLVKYRNEFDEPTLKRPLSNCMLLGKYTLKVSGHSDTEKNTDCAVACDPVPQENNEVQVTILESNKSLQDAPVTSGYDNITTKLLTSIFPKINNVPPVAAQYCIKQVIKDLYDFKSQDVHPVKALFRSLLEYWLINTNAEPVKTAMRQTQCTDKQSNKHFTKDKNLSSLYISQVAKQTQFHGVSDMLMKYKKNRVPNTSTRVLENDPALNHTQTDSFQKERRIQQLERLLKNTVYICETIKKDPNKQIENEITKTHREKLDESESDNPAESKKYNSVCSTEKLKETINHLISETSIPPDVAKEFLNAYLDILHKNDNSSTDTSSVSSDSSIVSQISKGDLSCESTTRASKSATDLKPTKLKKVNSSETIKPMDPGQKYLKDIIEKITTIFSKAKKEDEKKNDKPNEEFESGDLNGVKKQKDKTKKPVNDHHAKNLIRQNLDENSVVIDLTKFDLEHISMFSDPVVHGIMSITIKLKEKAVTGNKPERAHLNLQFADSQRPKKEPRADDWVKRVHPLNKSRERFPNKVKAAKNIQSNNPFIDCQKQYALRHYLSTSDATSKAYRAIHECDQSSAISFKSSQSFDNCSILGPSFENPSTQSCYMMSFKKELLPPNLQSRMKTKFKECGNVLTPKMVSPQRSPTKREKIKDNTTTKYTGSTLFNKPTSRAIDEKFILLLLENLSLLSKNVPSLHKEISNLFTKLRKKHEKILKSCINIQGLSLLGKIYNEESCGTSKKDVNTQWDVPHPVDKKGTGREKAVNTSNIVRGNDLKDANISAVDLTLQMNSEVQTLTKSEELKMKHPQKESVTDTSMLSNMAQTGSVNSLVVTEFDVPTIDNSTSNPNWFRRLRKKQCSISNLIKCMLDTKAQISNLQVTREQYVKRKYEKLRRDLIAEMSILSPGYKVSTQSQTDRKFLRFTKESLQKNDFNVYQLYFSKKYFAKTSSLTESNVEIDPSDEMKTLYRCTSDPSCCSGLLSPGAAPLRGPQAGFVSGTPGGRLAGWIIESGGPLDTASRELGQAQLTVQQLQRLLDALELQQQLHHDTDVSIEGASPNVKKDRRKFGLRKKKSNSKCGSVEASHTHIDPSGSHMALSALTAPPSPGGGASSVPNSAASLPIACAAARPQSLPGAETLNTAPGPASLTSLTPDHQLREDFTVLAKDLVANLKTVVSTLVCERGRLRAAMDAAETASTPGAVMATLRTNLTTALQQNSELRSRLSRIHDASDLAEISSVGPNSDAVNSRPFQQSLSYSSSCVSASEFFDAEEHEDLKPEIIAADESGVIELEGDSSSEAGSLSSEEGSASSDNSDGAIVSAEQVTLRAAAGAAAGWSRRTRLPSARPTPGGPSLWNLLYKNIGKDLSQISMPVTINEPLNMLQRLCEELEYSELLDSAAECKNAIERMALIAAFAVSAYASSAHRAASKPFNPLLAETYECVRDDKGFRFIAEQVSHHPPISACHAESSRWCFWQEARIKTKFWGKSMEFQPTGRVHVRLLPTGDHYSWNKVTTCVHNLFGGQRWVDQYGDMHITCHGTDITCKLNFIKASSWSSSRHEVRGAVSGGGARLRLAGRWSEALYAGEPPAARCLWRPGAMPPEHELYYGFTRFAMELNEMEPSMRETLPHTDTRLRPDQRALEEGDVDAAEQLKHQLEQSQRDRRRDSALHQAAWFRKTLESGEETWVFNGEYWKAREAGFPDDVAPTIW